MLSDSCPVLPVTLVHCGQTVRRIKVKVGMQVGCSQSVRRRSGRYDIITWVSVSTVIFVFRSKQKMKNAIGTTIFKVKIDLNKRNYSCHLANNYTHNVTIDLLYISH